MLALSTAVSFAIYLGFQSVVSSTDLPFPGGMSDPGDQAQVSLVAGRLRDYCHGPGSCIRAGRLLPRYHSTGKGRVDVHCIRPGFGWNLSLRMRS